MAYTHYNSDSSEDNDNDTTDFVIIVVDLLTPHTQCMTTVLCASKTATTTANNGTEYLI